MDIMSIFVLSIVVIAFVGMGVVIKDAIVHGSLKK